MRYTFIIMQEEMEKRIDPLAHHDIRNDVRIAAREGRLSSPSFPRIAHDAPSIHASSDSPLPWPTKILIGAGIGASIAVAQWVARGASLDLGS